MVACAYGAERIPGKPKYIRVTAADIERWYPAAGALFYAWMRPFVGRVYDIDALATLNPDVPAASTWLDFIGAVLQGWGMLGSTPLNSVAEQQVMYWLFLENCQCLGGGASVCTNVYTSYSAFDWFSQYSGWFGFRWKWTGAANQQICALRWRNNYSHSMLTAHVKLIDSGHADVHDWGTVTGVDDGGGWVKYVLPTPFPITTNTNYATVLYNPYIGDSLIRVINTPAFIAGFTPNGYTQYRNDIPSWADGTGFYYSCHPYLGVDNTSPTTPATPSQPSWTDIPSYTAPSGTTTDELEEKIDTLAQLVYSVLDRAKASQTHEAPYAYIPSTSYTGLTDDGDLVLDRVLGVKVTLTTIPGFKGSQDGTPVRHFDVGRIAWGDANGYHAHQRIEYSPQLFAPIPAYATKLGYTFPPGVVATIQLLLPE